MTEMRIIASKTLGGFAAKNASARVSVEYWKRVTRGSHWTSPADVLTSFPKAKVINAERVRFELAGNAFRMIVAIHWESQTVYVKFLGTHREYDEVDAATVSLF